MITVKAPPALSQAALPLALAAIALAVLLPLAALWGVLSDQRSLPLATTSSPTSAADTAIAASSVARQLQASVACAGPAVAKLPDADQASAKSAQPTHALRQAVAACMAAHPGLEQIFIVPNADAAKGAVPGDAARAGAIGPVGSRAAQRLKDAAASDRLMATLSPAEGSTPTDGSPTGVDLIMPLRDVAKPALLVLRFPWPRLSAEARLGANLPRWRATLLDGDDLPGPSSPNSVGQRIDGAAPLRLLLSDPASPSADSTWSVWTDRARLWIVAATLALLVVGAAVVWWVIQNLRASRHSLQLAAKLATAEAELREDVQESVSVGLRRLDNDGTLRSVNQAFCEMSGFRREDLEGRGMPYPFWPPDEIAQRTRLMQRVLQGDPVTEDYPVDFVRPDGSRWRASVRSRRLRDGGGWILDCTDITAEEAAQQILIDIKNRAVQQTAAAEFLIKMVSQADTAVRTCDNLRNDIAIAYQEGIEKNLTLVTTVAGDIQALVKHYSYRIHHTPTLALAPLSLMVEAAFGMCRTNAQAEQVDMHNKVSPHLPWLMVDKLMMIQSLGTLINRAIHAMQGADELNRRVVVETLLRPARMQVLITVRGSVQGVGMALTAPWPDEGDTMPSDSNALAAELENCRHFMRQFGGDLELGPIEPGASESRICLPINRLPDADEA